ncbi:MAG: hypothetical protein AB7N80_08645 [Bdellovibrionales bacterium]
MSDSILHVYKKYLPEGARLQNQVRGFATLTVLSDPHQPLGFGWHQDSRLASLMAIGHHLRRRLPELLALPMMPNGSWAYAVQRADARTASILRAVKAWALNHVRGHQPILKTQNITDVLPLETLREWLPDAKQAWGWGAPISFFEAEAGIMHLQFGLLMVEDGQGLAHLASGVSMNNDSPWIQALMELWWQRQGLQKNRNNDLIVRLMTSSGTLPWPGLRINMIQGYDLAQIPGDLPGHLWCASAEGGENEQAPTFN